MSRSSSLEGPPEGGFSMVRQPDLRSAGDDVPKIRLAAVVMQSAEHVGSGQRVVRLEERVGVLRGPEHLHEVTPVVRMHLRLGQHDSGDVGHGHRFPRGAASA